LPGTKKNADPKTREGAQRFFKESVKHYGVKSAVVGRIAREGFKAVKDEKKSEIFGLCEVFLALRVYGRIVCGLRLLAKPGTGIF